MIKINYIIILEETEMFKWNKMKHFSGSLLNISCSFEDSCGEEWQID